MSMTHEIINARYVLEHAQTMNRGASYNERLVRVTKESRCFSGTEADLVGIVFAYALLNEMCSPAQRVEHPIFKTLDTAANNLWGPAAPIRLINRLHIMFNKLKHDMLDDEE